MRPRNLDPGVAGQLRAFFVRRLIVGERNMKEDVPMNPFDLIDPELRDNPYLQQSSALTGEVLPMARTMFAEMGEIAQPDYAGLKERSIHIDGPAGPSSLRLYIVEGPKAATPRPLLYHVHGGGYVMGKPEIWRPALLALAASMDITIVSVDYRLAPEFPYPAPIEDCYAGLKWAFDHADDLGIDTARIAVAGESAGGGLAAALCLLARDRGEVPICFQRLIYPMLDDRTCTLDDPHPYTGNFMWSPGSNAFGWKSLLGAEPGGDGVSPYAAPARAEDLRGLPPTYIDCGALDLFLEENLEFARRLTRAGVPVELHIYPGAYHGFQYTGIQPGENVRVIATQARLSDDALRRALFG
jgi:triacylglycerol lipase